MNFKIFIMLIISITISAYACANTKNEAGLWLGYFSQEKFNNKSSLHFDAQLRHNLSQGKMNQTLVRFGYLHGLNDQHKLGLLFAYADSDNAKEYRPTLQHLYLGNKYLTIRQRLEFRDLENVDEDSWRYRLLTRFKNIQIKDDLQFVVWNEIFINLGNEDWTGNRTIERNRFFVGPRHKFKNFSLEWGYMNQFIPRSNKETYEHILVSNFIF